MKLTPAVCGREIEEGGTQCVCVRKIERYWREGVIQCVCVCVCVCDVCERGMETMSVFMCVNVCVGVCVCVREREREKS